MAISSNLLAPPRNRLVLKGATIAHAAADGSAKAREKRRFVSITFHLLGEHISDASFGLNDLRCARIVLQFAANAKNLHVNATIEHVFVNPGRLQKMLSAKRALWSVEEGDKQRIFAFGQRDIRAIWIGKLSGA